MAENKDDLVAQITTLGTHTSDVGTSYERQIFMEIQDVFTFVITHKGPHVDHRIEVLGGDTIDLRGMINVQASIFSSDATFGEPDIGPHMGYFSYQMRAPYIIEHLVPDDKNPKPPPLGFGPRMGQHDHILAERTPGGTVFQNLETRSHIYTLVESVVAYQQNTCLLIG